MTLIVAIVLATAASAQLSGIKSNILEPLQKTSEQLALHGRTAIGDFPAFRNRAIEMLRSARRSQEDSTYVRLAVFWPMFGADFGSQFREFVEGKADSIAFADPAENEFYALLFERVDRHLPTDVIFLDPGHVAEGEADSTGDELHEAPPLCRFLRALGAYPIPGVGPNFDSTRVEPLFELVRRHILKDLAPYDSPKALRKQVRLRVAGDLPVLLFLAEERTDGSTVSKAGALFIGNIAMLESAAPQGGFYTQDRAMVEVLEGLFASLWDSATGLNGRRDVP